MPGHETCDTQGDTHVTSKYEVKRVTSTELPPVWPSVYLGSARPTATLHPARRHRRRPPRQHPGASNATGAEHVTQHLTERFAEHLAGRSSNYFTQVPGTPLKYRLREGSGKVIPGHIRRV